MSFDLPARRLAEIRRKLGSLEREFAHWEELTAAEAGGMRRHHSQVRRLTTVLREVAGSLTGEVDEAATCGEVLERAEMLETQILAVHSVWEVFRSKLVLREDALFRDVLAACDDLAWECYRPAMRAFGAERRAPPLVYLTATWTPFAISRDANFQNEVRAGFGISGALGDDAFQTVLKRLPVPLIGVPWYHAFHLPGALAIAHETGHVVEFDFGLSADLTAAIDRADLRFPEVWHRWQSEVFADVYGCLCAGPAFAGVVIDVLSTSKEVVHSEADRTGRYPTRWLRVSLLLEVLRATGYEVDALRLDAVWRAAYGPMRTLLDVAADAAAAAAAIIGGPYCGRRLDEVVSFRPPPERLRKIGEAAARRMTGTGGLADVSDPRELFAGAQWLHENPQPRAFDGAYDLIVQRIARGGALEFRASDGTRVNKAALDAALTSVAAADRETGRELAAELFSLAASPRHGAEPPDHQGP